MIWPRKNTWRVYWYLHGDDYQPDAAERARASAERARARVRQDVHAELFRHGVPRRRLAQSAHPEARAVRAASGVAGLSLRADGLRRDESLPSGHRPHRPVPAGAERAALSAVGR